MGSRRCGAFSILVAQRTRELALLRALGATRGQVFRQVVTEAALTGVAASLLGFLLGILVADALIHLLTRLGQLDVQVSALIVSLLVGIIVTVGAAAIPARRATRIAPVAALREAPPELQSVGRVRIGAGLLLLAGGVAVLVLSLVGASTTTGPDIGVLGLSVLAVFLAVALLAPTVVRPVATVLGWPARLRGAPGRLAGENARRNPRRTALTAAALMVGLALVTSVAVLTDSLEASVDQSITAASGLIWWCSTRTQEVSASRSPRRCELIRASPTSPRSRAAACRWATSRPTSTGWRRAASDPTWSSP
jgi:putative ABC transport system permease protein